ncbi:FixH family protein [Methylocystis sp. ATCC 49242]|uniref:FixH family protein n=1 Tax=Methylocystis sp. ATCC 49242 TaxID=622637 RepID=UPI0001F8740C|nr:FixH family protein [Methylocystis sp. ATCC 49242]
MPPTNLRMACWALLALGLVGATNAQAAIADYEFKLVDAKLKKGQTVAAVRLIHKPDGKPVPDALIFATRLDMAPDDMEAMTSAIEQAPSAEPGVYRFKVDLTDEGRWRISLAAKVQGESETLQSRLVLQATP